MEGFTFTVLFSSLLLLTLFLFVNRLFKSTLWEILIVSKRFSKMMQQLELPSQQLSPFRLPKPYTMSLQDVLTYAYEEMKPFEASRSTDAIPA
jgi:hypothetical protein